MNASNFVAAGTRMPSGVNRAGDPINGTQFGNDPTWGNRIAVANADTVLGGRPVQTMADATISPIGGSAQRFSGTADYGTGPGVSASAGAFPQDPEVSRILAESDLGADQFGTPGPATQAMPWGHPNENSGRDIFRQNTQTASIPPAILHILASLTPRDIRAMTPKQRLELEHLLIGYA
jgi:hypothetical protein